MHGINLVLFSMVIMTNTALAQEDNKVYPLPVEIVESLLAEISLIEDDRDFICPYLTSEDEYLENLDVLDAHLSLIELEFASIQDQVIQVQMIAELAGRHYRDNEIISAEAVSLYYSSDNIIFELEKEADRLNNARGMQQIDYLPQTDQLTDPDELEQLCFDLHNNTIRLVKIVTLEHFRILAPYAEQIKRFWILIEEEESGYQKKRHKRLSPTNHTRERASTLG